MANEILISLSRIKIDGRLNVGNIISSFTRTSVDVGKIQKWCFFWWFKEIKIYINLQNLAFILY